MKQLNSVMFFAVLLAMFSVPSVAGHHSKATKNIVETAASAGQFNTLIAAAKAAGLAGALSGDGPLTVFAPSDEAFGALPAGTVENLLKPENRDQLARILKFHVVAGKVEARSLADGVRVDTLANTPATVAATEQGFTIEGARIVKTDIQASNGIVHVIDRVILPPETMAASTAMRLIESTISTGAPLFNHGQQQATAALYTVAVQSLMQFGGLDAEQMQRLQTGLDESANAGSASDSAWRLRYAMDDVYSSLRDQHQRMAMRMTAR